MVDAEAGSRCAQQTFEAAGGASLLGLQPAGATQDPARRP